MPIIGAKGSPSSQGFGQFAQASTVANYIEDVFSTYLYTGAATAQTFVNGIDLATKGGMVWLKSRSNAATNHQVYDTARGLSASYSTSPTILSTNTTDQQYTTSTAWAKANTDGFSLGTDTVGDASNNKSGYTYASWTFRKSPKFFDVVTYTGNGTFQNIAHNLGSVPGCIIIKATSTTSNWYVWHIAGNTLGAAKTGMDLNSTSAAGVTSGSTTNPSSTVFGSNTALDTSYTTPNVNGVTYVAYLFASNAGGFGLTGTDNVISCGSFTTDGSGKATVNLGYEPQFLLYKVANNAGQWEMVDIMRGDSMTSISRLFANADQAEATSTSYGLRPSSTGFETGVAGYLDSSKNYIYIAIRRGPMKVPTSGTSVFAPIAGSYSIGNTNTTGFPVDLQIARKLNVNSTFPIDRLRGISSTSSTNATWLKTNAIDAENTSSGFNYSFDNTKYLIGSNFTAGAVFWNFRRAPSFFDEVIADRYNYDVPSMFGYVTHNLGVQPEMVILKAKDTVDDWFVYHKDLPSPTLRYLKLNATDAQSAVGSDYWAFNGTTQFRGRNMVGGSVATATNSVVCYLFATAAGVSKVGSYIGTGATQTISCGFTGGARFVLVKRTDSTGDWYVWDTARGMVSGTDPSLLLNSTAAEVNANSIYTTTGGFQIVSTASGINASGGTYIFLAIA